MADPLSIASSVCGLIAISTKIVSMLKDLYDCRVQAKQAPESINCLMEEVQDMNVIFHQVQLFIAGATKVPSHSNLKMLSIHHLVATLSGCVLIASNLDKYLSKVIGISDPSCTQLPANKASLLLERVKWVLWKEAEVAVFIEELQRHKSSLNLMLGIIQCHTMAEASESLERLHEAVYQILESNTAISNQLRELVTRHDPPIIDDEIGSSEVSNQSKVTSILPARDDFKKQLSVIKDDQVPDDDGDDASIRTTASSRSTSSMRSFRLVLPSFTGELKNSRPYRRIRNWCVSDESQSTFTRGSSTRGCSWSMFSNMSLGELSISEISVIELPICLSDLWDSEPYQVQVPLHSAADHLRSHRQLRPKWSSRGQIHSAIFKGNENVIRMLLALGADIEERDSNGLTPLAYAAYMCREEICKLLLGRRASEEAIASTIPSLDLAHRIHIAVDGGSKRVVRLLLAMGVDIEERSNQWAMTPLLQALYKNETAIARLLIKKGADLFARDSNQRTAVHFAVISKDPEMLTEIVEQGAWKLINESDWIGRTPLHYSNKSLTLTKILIEHGASPNIRNMYGKTPYQFAIYSGAIKVAKYLWSQLSPVEQSQETPPPADNLSLAFVI